MIWLWLLAGAAVWLLLCLLALAVWQHVARHLWV